MIPIVKVAMPPKAALMPALEAVLYSGMIAEGEAVYRFEAAFGQRFGVRNPLAMSSGTSALHAALTLAGVERGDEVISTPMTAEPTNTSILYCGAKVVWADVDPQSGNLDPASVESRITSRTRAIVAVHYAGYPVQLAALRSIADAHGIALVEDCAHALGASYGGEAIGTIGDYGLYSFQAIKHMTTVDGGLLTLRREDQIQAAKKFRWFGMLKGVPRTEVDIDGVGYKYNMNNVTATIGLIQLDHVGQVLQRHIDNGRYYDDRLGGISGIDYARCDAAATSSYWLYTLLSDDSAQLEKALNANGISASKLHRPNNLHSVFKASACELPGLASFYKRLLHIPCGWWVSDDDRERIVEIIRRG